VIVMRRTDILLSVVTKLGLGTAEQSNKWQIRGISIFLSV